MMNFINYDLNKMFKDMVDASKYITPRADLYDNENSYLAIVDIPGVKKEDIKLDVCNNILTVLAKKMELDSNNSVSSVIERSSGEYKRVFELANLDENNIKAKYENGVLAIYIPKVVSNNSKTISIE